MKRTSKWLVALALVVCMALAVGITACTKVDDGGNETPHLHTWSESWSSDETHHWKAPTCGDTAEKKDEGAHVDADSNGKCDVCNHDVPVEAQPEELAAPVITLNGNVISWTAVEHADGYEVYEGEELVSTQTQTTYTIDKTEEGSYTYSVKATGASDKYLTSKASATVTYSVSVLAAPVITLNGKIILWSAVEHADGYEIYEGETLVSTQSETSYLIDKTADGNYVYTVKATSQSAAYLTSVASNQVEYVIATLDAPQVKLEENILRWESVENAVRYEVYEGENLVSTQTATTYIIIKNEAGSYHFTVKAISDKENYHNSTSEDVRYNYYTTVAITSVKEEADWLITVEWAPIDKSKFDNIEKISYSVYEYVSEENWTSSSYYQYKSGPKQRGVGTQDSSLTFKNLTYSSDAGNMMLLFEYTVIVRYETYDFAATGWSNFDYVIYSESSEPAYFDNRAPVKQHILSKVNIELEDNVITWDKNPEALGYNVYQYPFDEYYAEFLNYKVVAEGLTETRYEITEAMPGHYGYYVRATGDNKITIISAHSNNVEWTVEERDVTYTVNVDFPSTVTEARIGLYVGDSNTPKYSGLVKATTGKIEFTAPTGYYTVKAIPTAGYISNEVVISPYNPTCTIYIKPIATDTLILGHNAVKVNNMDEVGAQIEYYFVAKSGGTYTVISEETRGLVIFAGEQIVIDTLQELSVGSFTATAGERIKFSITGDEIGTFSFEIREGEIKQYIGITTGYGQSPSNVITRNCTRYIKIEKAGTYTFFFGPLIGRAGEVKFNIEGKEYIFSAEDDLEPWLNITFDEAREYAIEITVPEFPPEINYVIFYVYPATQTTAISLTQYAIPERKEEI